eukprot:CAMPEP_0176150644 /NCGR_PEP_ID=MMETSP0120_2-20121206/76918_1 /TAXON_ID=160619 /ORGANISM="Kryptoperidinium foliaceum, Strain CCMP 1326" /LENGTH=87 /DNA_ID=CAMNT_0017487569 /DNA_START=632 /DNA_END=892 /DNA_ORIENTATION=+
MAPTTPPPRPTALSMPKETTRGWRPPQPSAASGAATVPDLVPRLGLIPLQTACAPEAERALQCSRVELVGLALDLWGPSACDRTLLP